jgi:putative membrane protein
MKPSDLLALADRERIVAAVAAAEKTTSGEIVVAVVRACDEYGAAGWRCAALLAAAVLLAMAVFLPPLSPAVYLVAQVVAVAAGHLATRSVVELRRAFISEEMMENCARRRAAAAFADLGLRYTHSRTGILILVALLEHRVVVLADKGINDALAPEESWADVVSLVLDGIGRGDPAGGIVAAVHRCGEILAHPLPATDDGTDEIRRALVIED